MHALGRDNVAALAIGILQKSDVSGPVGVVLQTLDYGRDTVLAALPVDNSIVLFMTTSAMPCGNAPGIVTTAGFFLRADQGFMRRPFVQLRINDLDDETPSCGGRFCFYNCHALTLIPTPCSRALRPQLQCIVSELIRQERLIAIESFSVEAPKTKTLLGKLKELDISGALIVTEEVDENLYLASRNVKSIDVRDVESIDPVSLISYEKVLITVPALKKLEEVLA